MLTSRVLLSSRRVSRSRRVGPADKKPRLPRRRHTGRDVAMLQQIGESPGFLRPGGSPAMAPGGLTEDDGPDYTAMLVGTGTEIPVRRDPRLWAFI